MTLLKLAIASVVTLSSALALANPIEVAFLKAQIVGLAKIYEGQGDPDFSKQKKLDVLVNKLLEAAPQPTISERLPMLAGTWKQVWGPYNYKKDDRLVDPDLGIKEIYQVVSPEGYYYNVSPLYKNGDKTKERIGLLRGEYKIDDSTRDLIRVKFTNYPGVSKRPENIKIWELAEVAEYGELENKITIVPSIIVKLLFGKGALREVYTDQDLRITYGSNGKNFEREALYVLVRVSK